MHLSQWSKQRAALRNHPFQPEATFVAAPRSLKHKGIAVSSVVLWKNEYLCLHLPPWGFPYRLKSKRVPATGKGSKIPLQIMRFLEACTHPGRVRNTTRVSGRGRGGHGTSSSPSQDFQKQRTLVLSNNNLNQRHLLSSFSAERPFKLPTVCFGLLLKG